MFQYQCSRCQREEEFEERCEHYCSNGHKKVLMDRVYGFGGVVFKGPGFHKTDSRKKES